MWQCRHVDSMSEENIIHNSDGRYGYGSRKFTAGNTVLYLHQLSLQPHQAVVTHSHKAQSFICVVHITHFLRLVSFNEILLFKHLISFQAFPSSWMLGCFMADPQSRSQTLPFFVQIWECRIWGGGVGGQQLTSLSHLHAPFSKVAQKKYNSSLTF